MKHRIQLLTSSLVCITSEPSLIEYLVYSKRAEERFAVRLLAIAGGWNWHWDYGGGWVGDDVERAIEAEITAVRAEGAVS